MRRVGAGPQASFRAKGFLSHSIIRIFLHEIYDTRIFLSFVTSIPTEGSLSHCGHLCSLQTVGPRWLEPQVCGREPQVAGRPLDMSGGGPSVGLRARTPALSRGIRQGRHEEGFWSVFRRAGSRCCMDVPSYLGLPDGASEESP